MPRVKVSTTMGIARRGVVTEGVGLSYNFTDGKGAAVI